MLDRFLGLFRRRSSPPATPPIFQRRPATESVQLPGSQSVRRWESALTSRLNKAHWACVNEWTGHSINDDLHADLATLTARCTYEIANNPMVEGVVATHSSDVAGRNGPRLQVFSENDEYNEAIESAVAEFLRMPDVSGQITGPEMIRLWIRQLWSHGSFVNQWVSTRRENPFELALRFIDPRRLQTPPGLASDPNVAFGIRYSDPDYKPETYYVRKARQFGGGSTYQSEDYSSLPAEVVQHRYLKYEPDQLTGVPLMAVALDPIADIRDYDGEVMTAAQQAASSAVYWYTLDPAAGYVALSPDDTIPITRGTQQAGPPGWQPAMLQPTQPHAMYSEYRHERLRELGRAVHMPLMKILLSSEKQNFASAHYDDQVYVRAGVQGYQGWIEQTTLDPIARQIELEVRLALGIPQPAEVRHKWSWAVPPYVNPKDTYEALRMQLEDGTATYADVLEAYGRDVQTTVEERERINDVLEEHNLPPLPANVGSFQPTSDMMGTDETPEATPETETPAST